MNNVVYLKRFENNSVYVGITKHFKTRMKQHNKEVSNGSNKRVHRNMRKYNHDTEILVYSNCYEYVKKMEIIIIQNFKDLGYDVLNMTRGGDGVVNPTEEVRVKLREANKRSVAVRSKPIEYYEKNSIARKDFKIICENRKLNHLNFMECLDEGNIKIKTNKYFYKFISSEYKDVRFEQIKATINADCKYIFENPVFRKRFNKYCIDNNLNKDDFIQIFSNKSPSGKNRYMYKKKV